MSHNPFSILCAWGVFCLSCTAAIEVSESRLLPQGFGVTQVARLADGGFLILGSADVGGYETIGDPFEQGGCYVARFGVGSQLKYLRYLRNVSNCLDAAVGVSGTVWIRARPYRLLEPRIPLWSEAGIEAYNLDPTGPDAWDANDGLIRLDLETGKPLAVARFPSAWFNSVVRNSVATTLSPRLVVDSTGSPWIAGYAVNRFVPRPDLTQGLPAFQRAGTVMRLSPKGDQILFARLLGGRAVGALAIDGQDNVYAAGQNRVYKLSAQNEIVWQADLPATYALAAHVNDQSGLFVAGCTYSLTDFVATPGVFQSKSDDTVVPPPYGAGLFAPYYPETCGDGFVARLSLDGKLIYSTLIGGLGPDYANAIIGDDAGTATVSGAIFGQPQRTKDHYFIPESTFWATAYVARLEPDGASVRFFTYFPVFGVGQSAPMAMEDGGIGYVRTVTRSVDGDGNVGTQFFASLLVCREAAPVLPRVDHVIRGGTYLERNYTLEIRGEGFGPNAEVLLDGKALKVLSAEIGGDLLKTASFPDVPPTSPEFRLPELGAYRLTVRNVETGQESAPVWVAAWYRPSQ